MSQSGTLGPKGGSSAIVETLTGNSGGAVPPTGGNINTIGAGSITAVGSPGTSTVTFQLQGLTNHTVLLGAGTTTINPLTNGTTGQVLTAVTGGDPVWASNTGPAQPVNVQVFVNSGTYTPTSGMKYCIVEGVAGGGGGGGAPTTGAVQIGLGGGGGGGEYGRVFLSAAQVGVSQTVTIGAAGAAGANTGGTGGTGGTTSVGTLLVLSGGTGGQSGAVLTGSFRFRTGGVGGTGGTSSAGTAFFSFGSGAQPGFGGSLDNTAVGGAGGNSCLGGGYTGIGANSPGQAPSEGYGGGGSGAAVVQNQSGQLGGSGAAGIVIVTEFF